MRKFPHNGYELSAKVQTFYNGLNYVTRALADSACGGSITVKTIREANQLFEELAKNNYQAPLERGVIRKQGGMLELAKFEALIIKLNQQTPREPTIGAILYMQAQGAMMANPPFQVEEVNYVNNRGYTFQLNNNLPSHYHLGLRNHENFHMGIKLWFPMNPTS